MSGNINLLQIRKIWLVDFLKPDGDKVLLPLMAGPFLQQLHDRELVGAFREAFPARGAVSELLVEPGEALQRSGPVVILDLDRPEPEQLGDYRDNHRRDLRRLARLGVECRAEAPGEALAEFVVNYEATMRNLQAAPCYFFPPRYYRELLAAPSFDARLYTCRLDGQAICSGLFIFCGAFVQYHLGGTAPAFAALAPTKLMFDSVRRDAAREGRRHFCLGGGLGCREDSLFRFKAGFSRQTRDFCLIRKILDPEEYQRLSAGAPHETHYFPRYRALPA